MKGWIKIDRSILNHWIWQDEKYFRWWMTILLTVNHETKKFPVSNEIFVCNPGESFRSVEDWGRLFGCAKKTVIRFFELLKNDGMITTKTVGKGNRRKHLLTLVNWQKYQKTETENDPERKPKTTLNGNPTLPPNKNDKNDKNEKKVNINEIQFEFLQSLNPFINEFGEKTVNDFYNYWSEPNKTKSKIRYQLQKTWDTKRRLQRWIGFEIKKEPRTSVAGNKTADAINKLVQRIESRKQFNSEIQI